MQKYVIDIESDIPFIKFCVYSNDVLESEVAIDIKSNYHSVPVETLLEYSVALKEKFIDLINYISSENNIERSFNSKSAILSQISSMKARVDEYIDSLEDAG